MGVEAEENVVGLLRRERITIGEFLKLLKSVVSSADIQCLMFFFPIWIFAFYQFVIGDSKLAIFFAALSIALTLIPLAVVFVLSIIRARRVSSTAPSISPLYTSYRWFHSVGVLYRPYRQRFHYFWFIFVLALIARAGFIAFGPRNGWAQVIGNVVVEFILFIALLACRPHKDRKGDWLAPILSFFRLAAFGLLIAFIPSVNVSPIPRAIIGFVIIVMFGLPTVLLFFGLIFNAGYGYWWRRHTHRIEDGLEVERFVADDPDMYTSSADRESTRPMRHVDAANFIGGGAAGAGAGYYDNRRSSRPDSAIESRHNSGGSLARRTSIIEPVGNNVYEPSLSSRPSYSQRYSRNGNMNGAIGNDGYASNRTSRGDWDRYSSSAYDAAARGNYGYGSGEGHGNGYGNSRDGYISGATSPQPMSPTSPLSTSNHGHGWMAESSQGHGNGQAQDRWSYPAGYRQDTRY